MTQPPDERELAAAARGGRVAHSGFLDPSEAAAMVERLRREGVAAEAWGGFAGARRRVVTARPDHVPAAHASLTALYWSGLRDPDMLRSAARRSGVDAAQLGDVVRHADGLSLVTKAPAPQALLSLRWFDGVEAEASEVPVERLTAGERKEQAAIVASLRVDALGARAFHVSRAYFAKGVAAGRVSVNGRPADKASAAGVGDEVFAEGLGRFRVTEVEGETRRGNLKVRLEVELVRDA